MSLDAVRAASRVVGRRTTLRCLAIGVGASLLAACKGKSKGVGKHSGTGHGTSRRNGGFGSPSPTSTVAGRAFAAFVRGKWRVTSTMPGASGKSYTYTVTVGDGTWNMDSGGGAGAKGAWALQGGRLALRVPERLSESGELHDAAAENVPATVGDSVSLGLPWQPPGESGTGSGQRLEVDYNKQAGVRIRHFDASGSMTVHQCARV
ncbi:hypothetical protein BFF78_24115 [Streptomyces fodineus]|uniref:Lipoprotein n=2 Tax=Streptomyces fodineus TaxID=1904616 RepID=A0A1D7YDP7_9ACTN|nr:hypothetical protein BFF78_24115 [Streptomyces fodineus]